MTFSTAENYLFAVTSLNGSQERIYAYKTHWENTTDGREKVVSSWAWWEFPHDVLAIKVIDEYLYAVLFDTSGSNRLYLCRMDLRDGATYDTTWDWDPLIDFRIARNHPDVSTVFSGGNTTITLPYRWTASSGIGSLWVLQVSGSTVTQLTPSSVTPSTGVVVFNGVDHSSSELIFGLQYDAQLLFTPPVVRRPSGDRKVAMPDGELILLFWSVNFADSGRVRGRVTKPDNLVTANSFVTATSYPKTGGMKTGKFKFPVRVSTRYASLKIEVINDRPYPSFFVNAGWEANFVLRSRPV